MLKQAKLLLFTIDCSCCLGMGFDKEFIISGVCYGCAFQSINQFICRRQLNVNSHWRLLRVGTLKKPGLEAANKLNLSLEMSALRRLRDRLFQVAGAETRKLQGPIFLVRVTGTIRSPWAAERSMVRPATV